MNNDNKGIKERFEYCWPEYLAEDIEYVYDVLKRGEISFNQCSNEIYKFEHSFAEYTEAKYCLALNSGTSGLYLAYLALGIQSGDEVIVPAYTFAATVMPLLHLGARIVFVDTFKNSPCMSTEDLIKKVSNKTKAIVVAHMDGMANDIDIIAEIAKKFNCYLIEDCAQAFGAKVNGISVGNYGDIGVFSLQQKKLLAAGEGGVLVTQNRTLYEKCILYSHLQKRSFDEVKDPFLAMFATTGLGFNFRIHPLQAALAYRSLLACDSHITKRKDCLMRLAESIDANACFTIPQLTVSSERCSYYTFRFLLKESINIKNEIIIKELNRLEIPIELTSSVPLHLEPIFTYNNTIKFFPQYLNFDENIFRKAGIINSVSYCKRVFRMKPYEHLNDESIQYIANGINMVGMKFGENK